MVPLSLPTHLLNRFMNYMPSEKLAEPDDLIDFIQMGITVVKPNECMFTINTPSL